MKRSVGLMILKISETKKRTCWTDILWVCCDVISLYLFFFRDKSLKCLYIL